MPDLPTGIVTFLFTDIEGSTRLLERLGPHYRDLQVRHDALLRTAISEGGGHEVATEGDSFFAVFTAPSGAVLAATQAQRDLASESWPDESVVRVRMGIHTGEGVLGGENYLGLDVNRAARIKAAAHGGQVLVSDTTRTLVERSLPPGTRLEDLGPHRLPDLVQPERLHQLLIDGLEQDFPALRTQDARPNNLPAQLSSFIGRKEEIAQIRRLLEEHRLVTLTGPGGTGKTRLSLQVAAEALDDLRDGVFFVDLSALTDAELVAQEIAGTLRVRAEPGHALLDTLADHLRDKELLLVLDNFEQVTDAGSSVLEPMLRAAPGWKALVTSRVPLHLYGEWEYSVPPLGLPDPRRLPELETLLQLEAVALFAERAAASKHGFRVTPQNARAVAEITARLDGLPLAIELAASRVKLLSPEQLLARLEQRLPLLRSQDRNVPERQRTLRQTIEWSYELLDEAERQMYARLSVFTGGADLNAVAAVVNPGGELGLDTLDGLASLVDKNLLRSADTIEGGARFAMLETIREYGLERLSAAGEDAVIRRRHAEYWIRVVAEASTELAGANQTTVTRLLEYDHDNFRSALNWAVRSDEAELGLRLGAALRDFWRVGAHFREGVDWLETILALPAAAERNLFRARAVTAQADLSSWIGETELYLRRAEEAISIYRDLDDPQGIADALQELGVAQMSAGLFDLGRPTLEEARELSLGLGNPHQAATSTLALGMMAGMGHRFDDARLLVEEAFTVFTEFGDAFWITFSERLLGGIDRVEGNDQAAEVRFRASLSAAREHGVLTVVASDLYALADLALLRGQPERALRLTGASEAIRAQVGEAPQVEMAFVGDVAGAARSSMDPATADALLDEGRAMAMDDAVAYALETEGPT